MIMLNKDHHALLRREEELYIDLSVWNAQLSDPTKTHEEKEYAAMMISLIQQQLEELFS